MINTWLAERLSAKREQLGMGIENPAELNVVRGALAVFFWGVLDLLLLAACCW